MPRVPVLTIGAIAVVTAVAASQRAPVMPQPRATQIVAEREFSTLPNFVVERMNRPTNTDSYVVLTFDVNGQPVVAKEFDTPRRLIDKDKDGIYESEQVISDKVTTCQGLWVDGTTVYGSCMPVLTPEEQARETSELVGLLQSQGSVRGSRLTGGRGLPAVAGAPGGGARGGPPGGAAGGPPGGAPGRAGGGGGGGRGGGGQSGFFKMTDANGDGVAEITERLAFLPGSIEDHGAHAIRRGPDGSVMYMSGNNAGTPINQHLDHNSLILGDKEAQFLPYLENFGTSQRDGVHSALYRVDPDKKIFSVVTGGNRNTYDFAYTLLGEAFWFDSDMEPELGVPWYRQVRTVHGIPGGNYGYRNGSGKYPTWYVDSLPPVRDLNRGSPVGVETYQSYAYPREFFDNLLEADWSRGRLLFTALTPDGATYRARTDAGEFIHGEPLNITDIEIAPDGMLYFTTGGRNTEGGFWRVRYTGPRPAQPDMSGIFAVIRQPQPLSTWGWAAIEKAKASMGTAFGTELERVARDAAADPIDRVRALYEMQRHGAVPADALLQALVTDRVQPVRAAAVYVAGVHTGPAAAKVAATALQDADALVRRRALEAIVRMGQLPDRPSLVPGAQIYPLLNDRDRFVRWSARIALERTAPAEWRDRVPKETNVTGVIEGMLAWVRTAGTQDLTPVVQKQFALLKNTTLSADDTLRLLRVFQFTMTELPGGLSPVQREELYGILAPQFPSRTAGNSCAPAASTISCDERLNRDLALTLAYTQQPGAIAKILAVMPKGDDNQALQLHYLYGLRTIKTGWTAAQKAQLTEIFARASRWRGGMFSFVQQMFDESLEAFSADEKKVAYEKVPALAPLEAPPVAAPAGDPAAAPARGGGGGRGGGRGPGMTKQEIFERMIFLAGRGGGGGARPGGPGTPGAAPPPAGAGAPPGGGGGRGNPAAPVDAPSLFAAQCASCHKLGSVGTDVGGDLTGTKLSRRELLEAMFWPDQKVDPKYFATVLETRDGRKLRGLITGETATTVTLHTADAPQPAAVIKTDIRSRTQDKTSIMPDFFERLNEGQLNALVGYLLSGK